MGYKSNTSQVFNIFDNFPKNKNETITAWFHRLVSLSSELYTFNTFRSAYYKFYIKGIHKCTNSLIIKKDQQDVKSIENIIDIEKLKKLLLKESYTIEGLCDTFDVSPSKMKTALQELKDTKYNLQMENENEIYIGKEIHPGGQHKLNPDMWQGDIIKIGFVSDNHLCNYHSREEVLNLLYDIYADENISTVYNTGNWIDGEHTFNKNEIFVHGCTRQVEYCAKNYPSRKGIKTYFIAGDDHEGWYTQREGINVGEYLEMKRRQIGLDDMIYLGYAEADIELNEGGFEHNAWLRLVHPGGGSAYAISYAIQKLVESYQGGEKPSVILAGHFHKIEYSYPREVHCIQTGCTCDQTLFMRKSKIQAMVSGGILELRRAADGTINRVKPEFITFYDRNFYIGKDKYLK